MAKTLDEALDEMDQWGERSAKKLEGLSPQEWVAYLSLKESLKRLKKETGIVLNLKEVAAPPRRRRRKTRSARAS